MAYMHLAISCLGLYSVYSGMHNNTCFAIAACCCVTVQTAMQPSCVLCWYRSHTVNRQSAVVKKQSLVVRHSSHENLPANLLSASLEASHDIATPSGDPLHPRPSVTPAAAVRPALLQLQAAPQQTDISASKAAADSQNKSVSATGKLRATASGDVKSIVLPSTRLSREPFAAVQANSMSTNAAQSSGSHSSAAASGHRVQRSMAQGLQSRLADPSVLTAVRQVDDRAMLRRSEPASDSGLCSRSGSFGLSTHHTSQQASHMRLPVSANSGDTAASSSTTNTDAVRVDQEASMSHELADRHGEAVSTSKTRAESLAAAAASLGGRAGPFDDALGKEAGNHASEEGVVQIKAAKAKSGANKAGKQARNKGPSIEVGGNLACKSTFLAACGLSYTASCITGQLHATLVEHTCDLPRQFASQHIPIMFATRQP